MKVVLSIAGSDSSGGAGIQADLKTMTAHKVYGMTAITALTAQNTTGVTEIVESNPHFLEEQIDACLTDIPADAVKIGMLPSVEQVRVVARKLKEYDMDHGFVRFFSDGKSCVVGNTCWFAPFCVWCTCCNIAECERHGCAQVQYGECHPSVLSPCCVRRIRSSRLMSPTHHFTLLAKHHGFTEEEPNFIINCDINMGDKLNAAA